MPSGVRSAGVASARILVYALFAIGIAWIARAYALESIHTLENNGHWVSTKMHLSRGVQGAVAYFATRPALHRGRLDLGRWSGYHEVLYRDPLKLASTSFRFSLDARSAFAVVWRKNAEGSAGLLVNRRGDGGFTCYAADAEGRFVWKTPLEAAAPVGGWHRLVVRADAGAYRVEQDGTALGRCAGPTTASGRVGFRGFGDGAMWIDDVEIRSTTAEVVFAEDFDNTDLANRPGGGRRSFLIALVLVLGTAALVYFGVARLSGSSRRGEFAVVLGGLVAGGILSMLWTVDHFYLSSLHPVTPDLSGHRTRVETEADALTRLRDTLPIGKRADERRVLLIGTSQTWGAGATRARDTFGERLARRLSPSGTQVLTAAISGLEGPRLFEHYLNDWIACDPDVVVLNLGNNDADPVRLARALTRFVELNATRGIRTVFIPEANAPEHELGGVERNHAAMRQVAARLDVPVIELHDWLLAQADTGFLWWDHVHLSSYGHALAADHLYDRRNELLGN